MFLSSLAGEKFRWRSKAFLSGSCRFHSRLFFPRNLNFLLDGLPSIARGPLSGSLASLSSLSICLFWVIFLLGVVCFPLLVRNVKRLAMRSDSQTVSGLLPVRVSDGCCSCSDKLCPGTKRNSSSEQCVASERFPASWSRHSNRHTACDHSDNSAANNRGFPAQYNPTK